MLFFLYITMPSTTPYMWAPPDLTERAIQPSLGDCSKLFRPPAFSSALVSYFAVFFTSIYKFQCLFIDRRHDLILLHQRQSNMTILISISITLTTTTQTVSSRQ